METCLEYTDKTMWIFTDEKWLITRIMRLRDVHPEEVEIVKTPQENHGCLYCKVPAKWLKVSPPKRVNMTEEQRKAAVERMKNIRNTGRK